MIPPVHWKAPAIAGAMRPAGLTPSSFEATDAIAPAASLDLSAHHRQWRSVVTDDIAAAVR